MREIRKVLRLRFEGSLSHEDISSASQVSKGSVQNILDRFGSSGLSWPLCPALSDTELEARLYPPAVKEAAGAGYSNELDLEHIEREMHRPHVTRELLWREYQETHPQGMSRATFFRLCKHGVPEPASMKMQFKGGDKLFVDYSGDGLEYIDRLTGEVISVELFVCSWGASSYTYAECTASQQAHEFTFSHVRAFEYFGCAPHALVCDNLRSGVAKADRYEPTAAVLYEKMAEHYGVAVLPARVCKPQDKATVESAVGFAQRYILGRLRNRTFYGLQQINAAVRELADSLNREPMQDYGKMSRLQRFEDLDRPHARPLPTERFAICTMEPNVKVAPNYHVRFDNHHYSVPHLLARHVVDIHQVGDTVEIYHDNTHVCRHRKQPPNFGYTTIPEHMPPNHAFVHGWSVQWFMDKAEAVGPQCAVLAQAIFKRRKHPQQGFNSVLGLLNLVKQYGEERVEAASHRALQLCSPSYQSVKSILQRNIDKQPIAGTAPIVPPLQHDNIRGADYFAEQQSLFTNPEEPDAP